MAVMDRVSVRERRSSRIVTNICCATRAIASAQQPNIDDTARRG
jgi:hypothetical protein